MQIINRDRWRGRDWKKTVEWFHGKPLTPKPCMHINASERSSVCTCKIIRTYITYVTHYFSILMPSLILHAAQIDDHHELWDAVLIPVKWRSSFSKKLIQSWRSKKSFLLTVCLLLESLGRLLRNKKVLLCCLIKSTPPPSQKTDHVADVDLD